MEITLSQIRISPNPSFINLFGGMWRNKTATDRKHNTAQGNNTAQLKQMQCHLWSLPSDDAHQAVPSMCCISRIPAGHPSIYSCPHRYSRRPCSTFLQFICPLGQAKLNPDHPAKVVWQETYRPLFLILSVTFATANSIWTSPWINWLLQGKARLRENPGQKAREMQSFEIHGARNK